MTFKHGHSLAFSAKLRRVHNILSRDPYLASSLLQKSIRRGAERVAELAAESLHDARGASTWRRVILIAFEDVGIASPQSVIETVNLATKFTAKDQSGEARKALRRLVHKLAIQPKDRSSDYLIAAAMTHPTLENARDQCGRGGVEKQLELVADCSLPLATRATAAWYLSGLNGSAGPRLRTDGRLQLFKLFEELGVPAEVVAATDQAVRMTREPMTIMFPLLWLGLNNSSSGTSYIRRSLDDPQTWNGLPLYSLDKHTRIGKRAVARLLLEDKDFESSLLEMVPSYRLRSVAEMAAYYADAVPTAPQLQWSQTSALVTLGRQADFVKAGANLTHVEDILRTMNCHLSELNKIRARLLESAYGV